MLTPIHKTNYEPENMTQEQAQLFMGLTLADDQTVAEMINELKDDRAFQLVDKRAKAFNIDIDNRLKVFIVFLCDNPGTNSIYQHACWHIACDKDFKSPVTLADFAMAFGQGFPTKAALDKFWLEQKNADRKNMVDLPEGYKV